MSQILAATARRLAAIGTLGKTVLNALYPNDFELYLCALELISIKNNKTKETVRYFVFPIMPDSIREAERSATNIEKTAGGVVVNKYNKFIPRTIFLNGSFGRSFKVLIGDNMLSLTNGFSSFQDGVRFFDNTVKTGYGCIKQLESILEQSKVTVNEKGEEVFYQLVFHNLALGTHYLVEVNDKSYNQDMQSNMIWMYNLQLTAVAPISALYNIQEQAQIQKKLAASSVLQTVGKTVFSNVKSSLNTIKL